jgi:hypothetical protein
MRTAYVALAFVLALSAAGPAQAAKPKPRNSFCGAAKGVAANLVNATQIGAEGESASQLKAFYEKIVAARPALLKTAPGPVKSELTPVLSYVGVVVTDLTEVGWDPDQLAPALPDLNARAAKLKAPLKALKAYLDGTCKLGV